MLRNLSPQTFPSQSNDVLSQEGKDVMSGEGKDGQATDDSIVKDADVKETNLFNVDVKEITCQDNIVIGPDSNNHKIYNYLTKQAARLYEEFPHTVKGCVHSADILVDRISAEKDKLLTTEKGGYLTVEAKCLSDSGSDSAIANKTKGMMSLGVRNTKIHTAI